MPADPKQVKAIFPPRPPATALTREVGGRPDEQKS
jgi:hypothetical protein